MIQTRLIRYPALPEEIEAAIRRAVVRRREAVVGEGSPARHRGPRSTRGPGAIRRGVVKAAGRAPESESRGAAGQAPGGIGGGDGGRPRRPPAREPSSPPAPLCLVPCRGCRREGYTSGACHRPGHDGRHECNAVAVKCIGGAKTGPAGTDADQSSLTQSNAEGERGRRGRRRKRDRET
jgi:hypothetical protein